MLQDKTKTYLKNRLLKVKERKEFRSFYVKTVARKDYDPQLRHPSGLSNEHDISSMACALSATGCFCLIMDDSTVNFTASVAAFVLR